MTREDLLEALCELKHDLGKYILLPVAFLPEAPPEPDVRNALVTALLRTRVTPCGTRSAAQIWNSFTAECGESLRHLQSFEELRGVVARALSWTERLDNDASKLDRSVVQADLARVAQAIESVIEEVERG